MKKIRMMSIVVFVLATAAFTAFKIYEYKEKDTTAPIITCPELTMFVQVSAAEEELLAGVTAKDDRSGDVTDSLVVEHMTELSEEGTRTITYAAIDESGNVGRCQREMYYTGYEAPKFSLTEPLRFPVGDTMDILGRMQAESVLDGDLSRSIKYSLEDSADTKTLGKRNLEVQVTDSAGTTSVLNLPVETYDPAEESIEVTLWSYLIYIEQHTMTFDPYAYFAGAEKEGTLEVISYVDVTIPGVYFVDYTVYETVHDTTNVGKSRMFVVVE